MHREFSVAPMLNITDRHCRMFLRLLSKRMKLYTEMKVSGAIIYGDRERMLGFNMLERPLVLQLAGSNPEQLAQCARFAEEAGYDEINLNIGCPSERVQNGRFGACLMAEPELVAQCVEAMRAAVCAPESIPITVKTRIGIDENDHYEFLAEFIERVARGGCKHFIIHARKAWLNGISPKENRTLPELRYNHVYRLKRNFGTLCIVINGGIKTLDDALQNLQYVDGVMIGREAWHNPWILNAVDQVIFGDCAHARTDDPPKFKTRSDVIKAYLPYVEQQLTQGVPLRHMTRHIIGLFHGQPGARGWRQTLSENSVKKDAGIEVIHAALKLVDNSV